MRELLQDHDAGGKLSAARVPLLALCAGLGVAWVGAGVLIVVTHLRDPEVGAITWDVLAGWFKVGTGSLWPLVAGYVGGKGVGRIPKRESSGG